MAQLNDTLVSGDLRVTGKVYGNVDITRTADTTNGDKLQIGSGASVNVTNSKHAASADSATLATTASVAKAYDTSFTGTNSIKSEFDNRVLYTLSNDTSVIGTSAPAADCKAYLVSSSMPDNSVKALYNVPGNEATILFSKRATHGTVLKYGYADSYLYLLRRQGGTWKSDDWEKIYAGYADSAGSVRIEEIGSSAVNLDNYTASDGQVHYYTWSNGNRGNVSNKPTDAVYTVSAFMCGAGSAGTYVMQIAYKRGTTDVYIRRRSDGSTAWSSWQPFLYTDANVRSAIGIDTSSSDNTYLKKNGTWGTVTADTAVHLGGNYGEWYLWAQDAYDSSKPFVLLGTMNRRMNTNWSLSPLLKFEVGFSNYAIVKLNLHFSNLGTSEGTATQANAEAKVDTANIIVVESVGITPDDVLSRIAPRWKVWSQTVSGSKQWSTELSIFARFTGTWQCVRIRQLDNQSGDNGRENWIGVQWVSGSGSGSMVSESYVNSSPYHGFSAQSTGYFAGTANVASIALQTSVKNGTYGTTGYYETFAGYDGTNAKVAVADRYNNTNRGTEIMPGGVTTTGSVMVGGNIVCNGTLAAANVGQYTITYVPNGTISSSDWTNIKNANKNGKQLVCIVGGQISGSSNLYEKRVPLDYVVTTNSEITKFVFTTVYDGVLIGSDGLGYVVTYNLTSSGWSMTGGYPAIATAAVTAQNAIKWDGHALSLNAIDQTPGTISLV
jgi:hypothetical protein